MIEGPLNRFHAILFAIFGIFFMVMIMGLFVFSWDFGFSRLADLDVDAGQVNVKEAADSTIGQINNSLITSIDVVLCIAFLGFVIGIFGVSYMFKENFKALILVDIVLLVIAFFVSTYVSYTYSVFLTTPEDVEPIYRSFFENRLSGITGILLNLPIFVLIIGMVSMVVSYVMASKKQASDLEQGISGDDDYSIMDKELELEAGDNVVNEDIER